MSSNPLAVFYLPQSPLPHLPHPQPLVLPSWDASPAAGGPPKAWNLANIITISGISHQLQILPMSNPDVAPGSVETQQIRVQAIAPVGSLVRLRLRIAYSLDGPDQVDFRQA
ncbi:hypothetical protein BDP27DRAFT_1419127 [Rhodocollybia butyracea]|uniref:Uncharacterized protein n=1 Tax=Rhodocollybia butyracea TaxID=206335 RepID=A0A9P5PWP8_9AGAR|nr:hypothetical protein BDP27DRAFT_1419127 [Rhodocollybia butyracea]